MGDAASSQDSEQCGAPLEIAVADALGVGRVRLIEVGAGGSRAAYRIEIDGGSSVAFLRLDDGASGMSGTTFDLRREATVLRHVRDAGLPVPDVLATIDDPPATILEYVEGASRVSADDADIVGPEYMGWLAAIHRTDPEGLPFQLHATTSAAIDEDLCWWIERGRSEGLANESLVVLASRVLRATAPRTDDPPVLVHGDAGPGNFLVDNQTVTAILDWEMAHLGDWHEDLGWLWMRGTHSEFGDPQKRFSEYESASGRRVDRDRLQWHVAFTMFKTVVAIRSRLRRTGDDRLVLTQWVLLVAYEALLASALARVAGTSLPLLQEQPVQEISPESRVVGRLAHALGPCDRESSLILEHLELSAAHRAWRVGALASDARSELKIEPSLLQRATVTQPTSELGAVVRVIGRDLDRACWALPPALRRVRRAQRIGLGT